MRLPCVHRFSGLLKNDPDSSSRCSEGSADSEPQPGKSRGLRDPRVIIQRSARKYWYVCSSAFFSLDSAPLSALVSSAFCVTSVHITTSFKMLLRSYGYVAPTITATFSSFCSKFFTFSVLQSRKKTFPTRRDSRVSGFQC